MNFVTPFFYMVIVHCFVFSCSTYLSNICLCFIREHMQKHINQAWLKYELPEMKIFFFFIAIDDLIKVEPLIQEISFTLSFAIRSVGGKSTILQLQKSISVLTFMNWLIILLSPHTASAYGQYHQVHIDIVFKYISYRLESSHYL